MTTGIIECIRQVFKSLRKFVNFRKAEYILVSYPKSGRTWLRIMIGKAINDQLNLGLDHNQFMELFDLHKLNDRIPAIDAIHEGTPQKKKPSEIRFPKKYKDKKVIFLVRDPRDVIVSSYYEAKYRTILYDRSLLFKGSLSDYIRKEKGGIKSVVKYCNVWINSQNQGVKDFITMRYEDLHDKTEGELRKVLRFLGMDFIEDSTVKAAIEFGSFENMRKLEAENASDTSGNLRLVPTDVQDIRTYKTRSGKIGGFIDMLTPDDMKFTDNLLNANELMVQLGYSGDTSKKRV